MKRKLPFAIATLVALPALAAVLPFTENFNSGLGDFTVEDANQDGVTFKPLQNYGYDYSNGVYYSSAYTSLGADDWLFTPKFSLKKGSSYKLTYRYKVFTKGGVNRAEWKAGTEADAESMTVKLSDPVILAYDTEDWVSETINVMVPADGQYCIGLHLISDPDQGQIYFDDISIDEGVNVAAPDAPVVSDPVFSAVEGALAALFNVTLPSKNGGGENLDADTEITLRVGRDENADYATLTGKPGETIVYKDLAALPEGSDYSFSCLLGEDESKTTGVTAYPRLGTPKDVENLTIQQEGNIFTLKWDAVKEAINDSYLFLPSLVSYTVKCGATTIAENITDLSTTYTHPLPEEGQEAVSFTVTAYEGRSASNPVKSAEYIVGNPYTGEYHESFSNYSFNTKIWTVEGNKTNNWKASVGSAYPTIDPQDDDNGCLQFYYATEGELRIWSPLLDLSSLNKPKLTFYAYLNPSSYYDTQVQPGFMVGEKEVLLGEPIKLKSAEDSGWTEFSYDIPAEVATSPCRFMFVGTGGTYAYFYLDNISIKAQHPHNLAISLSVPGKSIEIGVESPFTVSILNKGTEKEAAYSLSLYAGEEKVAETEGPEVAPGEMTTAVLSYKALPKYAGESIDFKVVAECAGDADLEDNEASANVGVRENTLERPQSLRHNLSEDLSKVSLAWTAPDIATEATEKEITEGFENYSNGATEGVDGWIFRDLTGNKRKGINNINAGEAFPAMVIENFEAINPWELSLTSYEGKKCLAFCAPVNSGEEVASRIISPEVKGVSTVSFQTTIFTDFGRSAELTVYWSTGSTSDAAFNELTTIYAKDGEWVEKVFELPARAKRFAIEMKGTGDSPVLIDGLTYTVVEQPAVHTGYNVYRDHSLMATLPATATGYVDESPVQQATHTYHVTALYENGESPYSNPATVLVDLSSGVEEIVSEEAGMEIFNLQGLPLSTCGKGEIVIVRKGNKTFKAIMR